MATKYDVYNTIIQLGIENEFLVLPEFKVLNVTNEGGSRFIDLVWARRRPLVDETQEGNLQIYQVIAAFEIEGFDVNLVVGRQGVYRFSQHFENYEKLTQEQLDDPTFKYGLTVLYENAYDRGNWGQNQNRENIILERFGLFANLKQEEGYNDRPYEICRGDELAVSLVALRNEHIGELG